MTDPLQELAPADVTIQSLLYDRYAQDVLASKGINTSPRIELGDRSIVLNGIECRPEEFLTLFFQTRFKRALEYEVKELAPDELQVFNRFDKGKQYTVLSTPEGMTCQCQDYHNQLRCFQEHPATWEAIGGQPRCKHIMRAGIYWNDGVILSVVPERLIAQTLSIPVPTAPAPFNHQTRP